MYYKQYLNRKCSPWTSESHPAGISDNVFMDYTLSECQGYSFGFSAKIPAAFIHNPYPRSPMARCCNAPHQFHNNQYEPSSHQTSSSPVLSNGPIAQLVRASY